MRERFPSPSPRAGFTDLYGVSRRRRQRSATSFVHASGVCTAPLPSRGGGDSLAQTFTPAPEPMPFAAAANHAASLAPQSPFPLATSPLVGKETRLSKSAVPPGHGRRAMGSGSVLCTSGRRRTKMDGCGASGFSLKSYCSAIRVLQNVVVWRRFFTFYTEKIVLSQSSCIFVHGISSDGNKCARCRTRAPRGPMKITTSRIPLLADVLIGTTVCTRIDPYRRINSLHRKQ